MQKGSSLAILNPLDLLELFISMIELMIYVCYSFFSPVVSVSHVCIYICIWKRVEFRYVVAKTCREIERYQRRVVLHLSDNTQTPHFFDE